MCPDPQILSLYHDGELPSPWKEKLQAHLASCPACTSRLEGFRRLSTVLAGGAFALEGAKTRVWQRLAVPRGKPGGRTGIWSRRVSLPFPAAAAAAAVLVIAFVIAFRAQPPLPAPVPDSMAAGLGLDLQGIPAADMNGILQYLGDTDAGDTLIIRLPESKNFASFGEPTILKAADYSRNSQR